MLIGKNVLERTRTGGVQHDVLVETPEGYELYELTGQARIEWDKVSRFRDTINQLADYFKRNQDKRLAKAYFISMVSDDAWSENAKNMIEQLKKDAMQKLSCEVQAVNGVSALKQVLESGALGLRLIGNRIYLAGPEEYAIRFNPKTSQFEISFINLDLNTFRKTPFLSFHHIIGKCIIRMK